MKFLSKYTKFFESSQSKKIRKYIGYSIVLEWYRVNKEKIAQLLNCDVSELVDEDTLMQQSYGLVNSVINDQIGGNSGISGTNIPGFESFERIENNLIHDILHNMFNVSAKSFEKSLSDIQFTESEVLEEIECLGIEESFMKYMNIQYLKTDFINANINQLASYLMMAILKNDPERIRKILDKEVEPYLEVYGKKYPVDGTAFEKLFDMFENTDSDRRFKIKNSDDFKEYMIKLINVGQGISDSNGDRAQYPDSGYFGTKEFYDLSDDDVQWRLENKFEDLGDYILINKEQSYLDKFKFDYVVIDYGINILTEISPLEDRTKDIPKKEVNRKLKKILKKLNFNLNTYSKEFGDISFQVFPDDINYDDESIAASYWNKKTDKAHSGHVKIENLPLYFQQELKFENANHVEPYSIENFEDKDDLRAIPIKLEFVDRDNNIVDMDKWFDYLKEIYSDDIIYELGNNSYIGISYEDDEDEDDNEFKRYKIMYSSEVIDEISEDYNNGDPESFDDDHAFINFNEYREMSFEKVASRLFKDSDSISIMRRNFRLGDIVKNNTKIGNISKRDADTNGMKEIKTKNKRHKYIDFVGYTDTDKSISKAILTDNAKKLKVLLDNFRGYVISNFKRIKENSKKNTKKFTNNDIKTFKKLNLNDLKTIESLELNGDLSIILQISYSSINSGRLSIHYNNQGIHKTLYKFYSDFEDMQKFSKLIENEDDIEYLKNFVNLSGDVKTSKDYYELKKAIARISKKDVFKWKEPIMAIYSNDNFNIKLSPETINVFKKFYDTNKQNGYKIDLNNEKINKGLVDLLHNTISEYYPNLKTLSYSIKPIDCDNMDTEFKIIIE